MTDFFYNNKRNVIIASVVTLLVVGVLAFFTLRSNTEAVQAAPKAPAAPSAPAATSGPQAPANLAHPQDTLPQVKPPAPGSVKAQPVTLSDKCAKAVAPVRELAKLYSSGADVRDPSQSNIMTKSMATANSSCTGQEMDEFQKKELLPWLRAAPAAVPAS